MPSERLCHLDGSLATRTWARDLTTTYSYDSIGQLTNTLYSDGTPPISIAYNRLGQKTRVLDASGTNTFAYNSLLLLTNETNVGQASSLSRAYDGFGRASGLTLGNDYVASYSYDSFGRFSSVSSSVSSVSSVVDYSRLDGSSLISGYSIAGVSPALSVSYDFEPNRNLKTSVASTFSTALTNSTISSFSYTYDELGRRTQRLDTRHSPLATLVTNLFAYNDRSELTSALMGTNDYDYGYDNIGNREFHRERAHGAQKETRYAANALNQYLGTISTNLTTSTVSTNIFSYDLDGNLTNDSLNAYTWNGENRLIKISPINPAINSQQLVFAYDAQGRRFSKKVYTRNAASWSLTSDLRFLYDGWAMIRQESATTTNSYVYGLDLSGSKQGAGTIGGLLWVIPSDGGVAEGRGGYFPCFDANGNITDYVDTNGTIVAHYEYDPYAKFISSSGSKAGDFNILFSSKYLDRETDLYYYGYRYYSSELGRWLSRDPLGEQGGLNLYVFCENNSANQVDAYGHCISYWLAEAAEIAQVIAEYWDLAEAIAAALQEIYDSYVDAAEKEAQEQQKEFEQQLEQDIHNIEGPGWHNN